MSRHAKVSAESVIDHYLESPIFLEKECINCLLRWERETGKLLGIKLKGNLTEREIVVPVKNGHAPYNQTNLVLLRMLEQLIKGTVKVRLTPNFEQADFLPVNKSSSPVIFRLGLGAKLTLAQKQVYSQLMAIPRGNVTTYRALASKVSLHPRAVGQILRANPYPLIIPCHRVIRSDGSVGGYGGTSGVGLKLFLIQLECSLTNRGGSDGK